jgi:hypothetical protein
MCYGAVNLYENLLGNVFGIFCILKDAKGCIIDAVLVILYQVPECRFIAILLIPVLSNDLSFQ